jgi:hypothetical protein
MQMRFDSSILSDHASNVHVEENHELNDLITRSIKRRSQLIAEQVNYAIAESSNINRSIDQFRVTSHLKKRSIDKNQHFFCLQTIQSRRMWHLLLQISTCVSHMRKTSFQEEMQTKSFFFDMILNREKKVDERWLDEHLQHASLSDLRRNRFNSQCRIVNSAKMKKRSSSSSR